MRRCLHAFLIAVLLLAPAMNTARACWHMRARRHCPPAYVVQQCLPQGWDACGEIVVAHEMVVDYGCCEPIACPPPSVGTPRVQAAEAAPGEHPSVVAETPREAHPESVASSSPREHGDDPLPDLRPPVEPDVTPASNDEPVVAEPAPPSTAPETAPVPPPTVPVDEPPPPVPLPPVEAEPVVTEPPAPEVVTQVPPVATDAPAPVEPVQPVEPSPEPAPVPAPVESPEPEPTPEPVPELAPQPTEAPKPEPAPPVTPEPAAPNIFEEVDGGDSTPAPVEAHPAPSDTENAFDEVASEAAAPADVAPAPSAPGETAEMPADDSQPSDPFGEQPAPEPVLSAPSETPAAAEGDGTAPPVPEPAEPATADPFPPPASEPAPVPEEPPAPDSDFVSPVEPARRWIHASGSHALVATLVDVKGDGTCVLEADGVRIRVPLDNLSGHDREYVGTAAVRIAARRDAKDRVVKAPAAPAPAPNDTAGL